MHTVFRWNITRREQLGRLVEGEPAESYAEFLDDLRRCCARVLAMAGDARLVFVGRSPESLYDYLIGALAETSWSDRLAMLNVSLFRLGHDEASTPGPAGWAAFREQLDAVGLEPAGIASSARAITLIDLVSSGDTMDTLVELLLGWAVDDRVDVRAVRRRLRIVGIIRREQPSPKTWRWRAHTRWVVRFRPSAVKDVAVPDQLWDYLGNMQAKVARTNPPSCWGDPEMHRPPRDPGHAAALRLAVSVYELARTRDERKALARLLASEPAMRHPWLRRLVTELRS